METKITLEYKGKKYERRIADEEFCADAIKKALQHKIDPLDTIVTLASLGYKAIEEGIIEIPDNSEISQIKHIPLGL